jgi:hypothetical protein
MNPSGTRFRHGLNVVKGEVKLRGLAAIDMRTVVDREIVAFRDDLASALCRRVGAIPLPPEAPGECRMPDRASGPSFSGRR